MLFNNRTKRRLSYTFWSRNPKKLQKSASQLLPQLNPQNQKYTSSVTRPKKKLLEVVLLAEVQLEEVPLEVVLLEEVPLEVVQLEEVQLEVALLEEE